MFYFIKIGIAFYLAFSLHQIKIDGDDIKISLAFKNILTTEMKTLLDNGVEIEFQIYFSIIAFDNSNNKYFFKNKSYKKAHYDFLNNNYVLIEGDINEEFADYESFNKKLKQIDLFFEDISDKYEKFDFFCEISLVENQIIKETLNMGTSSLWDFYKPNVRIIFNKKGEIIK